MHATTSPSSPQPRAPHVGFTIHQMENGFRATEEVVREKFAWSTAMTRAFNGYQHRVFTCLEDPEKVYQIGGWNSVDEHYLGMHMAPVINDFLDEFGGVLDVKACYHTDISYKTLAWDAPYLTFVRCWVPKSRRSSFESALYRWLPSMMNQCGAKVSHGWRLDGGWIDQGVEDDIVRYDPSLVGRFDEEVDEAEEWNLIMPWNNADDWAKAFDMATFSHILQNLARLEVRHLQPLDTNFAQYSPV